MNCTRARSEIALWVGGDVDEREAVQLQRHLALCPECRAYRCRMKGSLQMLQEPASPTAYNLHDSVWPNVESRLSVQSRVEADRVERLNRWLPAAAIAAACLAVIAITSEPQPRNQRLDGEPLPSDLVILQSLQSVDSISVDERQAPGNGVGLRGGGSSIKLNTIQAGTMGDEDRRLTLFYSLTGRSAPDRRFGQY
ncbi:MAG: zf-HC2 domain-containing protein [Planctomycetaceae bacterium]|jgi:hypothetical protein|nr:zf-HC2 domain-containing protein [Planctomycetaceae bacterium]MBT6155994.1 zf-HC2 domain-containing protein [Planctomycetaceae bacterium]MBT6484974.1 zf-HC2 domain-containing protein [Planctomycetaceae bacterium]MBT6494680.1 zf-HC2 domain-containing protein [Planctomycetaceae bacterium]